MTQVRKHMLRAAFNHLILLAGVAFLTLPVVVIFVSSTHDTQLLVAVVCSLPRAGKRSIIS